MLGFYKRVKGLVLAVVMACGVLLTPNFAFAAGDELLTTDYTCGTEMYTGCKSGYFMSYGTAAYGPIYDATPRAGNTCSPCPDGYTCTGGTAAPTITCAAGTRVVSAGAKCTTPSGGWWTASSHTVNYGQVSLVNYCMAGYNNTYTAAAYHKNGTYCRKVVNGASVSNTIPARYIKVTTGGSTANAYSHVVEIQAFASVDGTGTNLLSGKGGTSGTNLTNATDGSWTRDKYASGTMVWDMGSTKDIGSIKFALFTDGRTYNNVTISVSTNNSTWTTVLGPISVATQNVTTATGEIVRLKGQTTCAAGTYATGISSLTATKSCTACAAGTYQDKTGQISCTECAIGSYTSSTGAKSCTACQDGTTTSGTGQTSCNAACSNATGVEEFNYPTWHDNNTVSAVCAVWSCKAGYYLSDAAYDELEDYTFHYSCKECSDDVYRCPGGRDMPVFRVSLNPNGGRFSDNGEHYKYVTLHSDCFVGETGKTCESSGFGVPIRDGYTFKGWYTAASGGTQITGADGVAPNDPADSGIDKTKSTTLYAQWTGKSITCAAGKYLPASSETCSSCPAGYYCSGGTFTYTGSQQGLTGKCAAGTYSSGAKASCTPCEQGSYNNVAGSSTCTPCQNGTTTNGSGQTSCNATCQYAANTETWRTVIWAPSDNGTFIKNRVCEADTCKNGWTTQDTNTGNDVTFLTFDCAYPVPITIHYQCDGTTDTTTKTCYVNQSCPLDYTGCSKTGYTQNGWYVEAVQSAAYGNYPMGYDPYADGMLTYLAEDPTEQAFWDNGAHINVKAQWSAKSITCSAGKYLPASSETCSSCPAGYYCSGGTFTYTGSMQGRTGVCASGYSTGGASTSTCTECKTDYAASGTSYTDHNEAKDCKRTITLDKNGGSGTIQGTTGTTSASVTCLQGVSCSFGSASGLTQTGYTFTGGWDEWPWCTSTDTSITNPTVSLYKACKTANTYTVKFNVNGGSGTMADQSRTYNDGAKLSANTFTRTGYTFSGWNTKADGSGTSYADQATGNLATTNGATVTLYAKWSQCASGSYCPGDNTSKTCPSPYSSSAAGSDNINDCYLTTTSGNYVAETGKGQVTCACGGYCAGGTKVYYSSGVGSTTGGRTTCSAGTYNGSTGSSASSACVTTSAGYYAAAGSCSQTKVTAGCYGGAGSKVACPNSCPSDSSSRTVTSAAGSSAATDCYVSCASSITVSNGTTSVVDSTPNYNGSAYPACTYNVNCSSGYGASGNKTASPSCTICGKGTYSTGGTNACSVCSGNTYNTSTGASSCSSTCPTGYSISGTAASNHDAKSDCQISCGAGTQVVSSDAQCTTPNNSGYTWGWYTSAHSVSAGSTSGTNVKTCSSGYMTPNTTSSSAHDSSSDCALQTYNITYNLNGGTNSSSNPSSYNVTTATITLANPTKTGYTFVSWHTDSGLTSTAVNQISKGSTGNKTFYAKWSQCASGSYCPGDNTSKTCPSPYSSSAAGSDNINDCYLTTTSGNYVAETGKGQVTCACGGYCAGGTKVYYSSGVGSTTGGRTTCSAGTYNGSTGSSASSACVTTSAGYYAAAGSCSQTKVTAGCYGGAGSKVACPNSCPSDSSSRTVTSAAGSSAATDCYVSCGSKTINNGTASVKDSTPNYDGTSYPACKYDTNCNGGYYGADNVESPSCNQCAAGKYSTGNATSCTSCAAGSYSSAGASSCTACSAGTTSSAGSSSCSACSNSSNVSTWDTPSWTANTTSNVCSVKTCATGYSESNNACVANTYEISLDTGSSMLMIKEVYATKWTDNADATITSVSVPSKTGYTFMGYYTSASGGEQRITAAGALPSNTTFTSNTTLYAQWSANKYTVTYNSNKPSAASGSISGSTADSSHTFDASKALTANGYSLTGWKFLGWNTSSTATTAKYTDGQSVKNLTSTNGATVTLYAIWQANCNKITLNAYCSGSTYSPNLYKKSDETGWYSDSSCSVALTQISDLPQSCNNSNGGFTLRGVYSDKTTTLSADGNTGTQYFTKSGKPTTAGTNLKVTATKTIYLAWAKDCAQPDNGMCSLTVSDNGAVDYTASCNDGYTVSNANTASPSCTGNTITINYVENGGAEISNTTCTYGDTFKLSTTSRSGYALSGWTIDGKGFKADVGHSCTYSNLGVYSGSVDATANWKKVPYTITYMDGDVEMNGLTPTSYDVETAASLPTVAYKSTKKFVSWHTDAELTSVAATQVAKGSTGNKVFYAKWESCPAGYACNGSSVTQCTGTTYAGAGAASCSSCPSGYIYNTTKGKTSAQQCQIRCAGGSYLATAKDASCSNVGAKYYKAAHTVNYNSTSSRSACATGLTTIGYGTGADEAGDCGRILHVDGQKLYLRSVEKTDVSLHVKIGDTVFFGNMVVGTKNMSAGTTKTLKIKHNGQTYSVYDDSVN